MKFDNLDKIKALSLKIDYLVYSSLFLPII
jgi:hypothetical protein